MNCNLSSRTHNPETTSPRRSDAVNVYLYVSIHHRHHHIRHKGIHSNFKNIKRRLYESLHLNQKDCLSIPELPSFRHHTDLPNKSASLPIGRNPLNLR